MGGRGKFCPSLWNMCGKLRGNEQCAQISEIKGVFRLCWVVYVCFVRRHAFPMPIRA